MVNEINSTQGILADTAGHEFNAWNAGAGLTPDRLVLHAPRHVRNAATALQKMYLSKAELVAQASDDRFLDMVEDVADSAAALEEIVIIMKAAAARMLSAAATEVQQAA
ncbi:MAG: hypothetical protein IBJ07_08985 [Rhizobiaceae bacterium]|nr:hypothetical protein [Rhizobiaceae bacterium]